MLNISMPYVNMDNMIVGLPESTFFIVLGAFVLFALLLLIWAFTFRSDNDGD